MAQVIGNIQPTMKSGVATTSAVRGVGTVNWAPVQGSWTQVAGKSGEVVRLSVNQAQPGGGPGIAMQASIGVSLRFSLSNPGIATDPELYADASWTAVETLTAGAIVSGNGGLPFTAVEITFSGNGIFAIYSR